MASLETAGGRAGFPARSARPVARAGEWVLALLLLVSLAPLMLVLAGAVRLSGPVFFRQQRLGQAGQVFTIIKFRSLPVRAGAPAGWFGQLLRASAMDELPQLLNVLRGEMALVGPRPYVADMRVEGVPYGRLCPRYGERLAVRPGMTGLAQVAGWRGPLRDVSEAERRLALDLAYIAQRSAWLDLFILCATPLALLRGRR